MVERFDGPLEMQPYVNGDYVLYSDYAELKAENERLRLELHKRLAVDIDAALSRTGAVKVLAETDFTLVLRDDAVSLWCSSSEGAQQVYSAIENLTALEPAAPEGRQEAVAWWVHDIHVARQPVKAKGIGPEPTEYLYPADREQHAKDMARIMGGECTPLYTRPAEQAVTEAMVEAAVQAVRQYTRETLLIDEHRELVRAALKAAMEAGR